jgi:DNA polymerase III delta prime subunit
LIGMAGQIAKVQIARVDQRRASRIKLLLHGDPGCGKSAACRLIGDGIAREHSISRLSACQLNADMVRDWLHECRYSRSEWRVYHLDECDAINPTVGVLMLQFLDEVPPMTAVLCTSNESLGELSDRFQSRFQTIQVRRPAPDHIADFLAGRWPKLADVAQEIAGQCGGDVRAALNDAQAHLDFEMCEEGE